MSPVTSRMPTGTAEERTEAISAAGRAISHNELVVLPTDTVYGIGADAFDAAAVAGLLGAKGRGREMPPPVLIGHQGVVKALITKLPEYAQALLDDFWPGPLTVVGHQQESLQWDLGDTLGTVAVRMPDHPVALELLGNTGPLAVSSANRSGLPAAMSIEQAEEMLGDTVAVYLDAGVLPASEASTIVDVTTEVPRILRLGALSLDQINETLVRVGEPPIEEDT